MNTNVSSAFPRKDRFSFAWLLAAFVLLVFSNGMNIVPLAAWLAPVFLVRFLRTQRALPGLILGYLACAAAFYFQWSAAFKDAGEMFGLYTAAFGLLVYLPYLADRLMRPRLKNAFIATLVLPAAMVSLEYLLHLVLPLGTFFNIAYTQSQNLPLLQIMSVTGLWGVSFLVVWFAGIANYAWEAGFEVQRIGKGAACYAAILAAVLLFGGLRLALERPTGPTVQVAVLTTNLNLEVLPEPETPLDQRLLSGALTAADRQDLQARLDAINSDLIERTRAQARAGAKIITWTEYNAHIFAADEAAFLAQIQQLAAEEGIYLVFPLAVIEPDPARRPAPELVVVNKSVMITPEGQLAYQYVKHNLLIGWESEHAVRGERRIQVIDTPYGRLASVICLDMEYPDFMRQAGEKGVDILLSGAIDGTPSSNGNPLHSIMASYRAIENGFSLGRGGSYGQNIAVDYLGHVLGSANHLTAADRSVVAFLPTQGVPTLYTRLGDFFPWLCLIGLSGLLTAAISRKKIT